MTTTAGDIKNFASFQGRDTDLIVFDAAAWYRFINDAQRIIAMLRPDAKSVTENISLALNTSKQTIPAGRTRLLQLIRNMGTGGATPGKGIRGPIRHEAMDAIKPDWHTTGSTTGVTEYVYNELTNPKAFYVYPHQTATWYVEGVFGGVPTAVAADGDSIDLDDIYAPAVVEWCLYRAWGGDDVRSPNYQRAMDARSSFYAMIGAKVGADLAMSPQLHEQGRQLEVGGR